MLLRLVFASLRLWTAYVTILHVMAYRLVQLIEVARYLRIVWASCFHDWGDRGSAIASPLLAFQVVKLHAVRHLHV